MDEDDAVRRRARARLRRSSNRAAAAERTVPAGASAGIPERGCGSSDASPRARRVALMTAIPDRPGSRADALPSVARTRAWGSGSAPHPAEPTPKGVRPCPERRQHALTDEERAERRRADREYARQAVEQLRSSRRLAALACHAASLPRLQLRQPTADRDDSADRDPSRRVPRLAEARVRRAARRARDQGVGALPAQPQAARALAARRRRSRPAPANLLPPGPGLRQVISCSVRRRRRRPRRATLPAAVSLPFVRAPGYREGTALACAVVAEPAPGGRRRSGDRARVSPGRLGVALEQERRDRKQQVNLTVATMTATS